MSRILIFKDWLEENGISSEKFWENCLPENQKWPDSIKPKERSKLIKRKPEDWIFEAFDWKKSGSGSYYFWLCTHKSWLAVVKLAKDFDIKIEFGFKEE